VFINLQSCSACNAICFLIFFFVTLMAQINSK
jgi:hypothetical protein